MACHFAEDIRDGKITPHPVDVEAVNPTDVGDHSVSETPTSVTEALGH